MMERFWYRAMSVRKEVPLHNGATGHKGVTGHNRVTVVFDLDDTLYKEIDFVQSGYRAVARVVEEATGRNILSTIEELARSRSKRLFDDLVRIEGLRGAEPAELIRCYREHAPTLSLPEDSRRVLWRLTALGIPIGLLTDGRSVTQRNKLRALRIEACFQSIVISEEFGSGKPDPRNYQWFERTLPAERFMYVADNPAKDFVAANELGWHTVLLRDDGRNIHSQEGEFDDQYRPNETIDRLDCILETL
jgi:putative hydrolase of the HAD superfamily